MRLSAENINKRSPYWVIQLDDMLFRFRTKNGITYRVGFQEDRYFKVGNAYNFFITNVDNSHTPRDLDVFKVISLILEEFFRQDASVMLYICDPTDHREKVRSLLYKRWYNNYPRRDELTLRDVEINFKGYIVYSGMIIRNDHPQHDEMLAAFDEFTSRAPLVMDVQPKP